MKPLDHLITRTLDDGLVVARPGGHRLFVMNASARFIWERRLNGDDDARIPVLMSEHYGIDIERARSDFHATLARWRADGLTGPAGPRRRYAIGAIRFSIEYPDLDIEAIVAPIFDHLQAAAQQLADDGSEREFAIDADDGRFALRKDGLDLLASSDLDLIIEALVLDVVMTAYDGTDWLMSTHAAAVGTGRGCIMLPGASGVGKSTLTASLVARPHLRYLTDDIVLLDRTSLEAVPLPGALVLKRGSWEPLARSLPELASRSVHRRHGQDVKYWAPPSLQVASTSLPVLAVVFPERHAGAAPALAAISPLEGLSRMIAAPTTISPPMTAASVDRLMQWAERIPFYSFSYDHLDDAADPLEDLLGR